MDFEDERIRISNAFQTFWNGIIAAAGIAAVPPLSWNNQPFTQPPNTLWCRFSILPVISQPSAIGQKVVRSTGIMTLQIFSPGTTGTSNARKIADAMSEKFNFKIMLMARGYLHFQTLTTEDYGPNSSYHQLNANIPFWRDTRRQPIVALDGGNFINSPDNNVDGGTF